MPGDPLGPPRRKLPRPCDREPTERRAVGLPGGYDERSSRRPRIRSSRSRRSAEHRKPLARWRARAPARAPSGGRNRPVAFFSGRDRGRRRFEPPKEAPDLQGARHRGQLGGRRPRIRGPSPRWLDPPRPLLPAGRVDAATEIGRLQEERRRAAPPPGAEVELDARRLRTEPCGPASGSDRGPRAGGTARGARPLAYLSVDESANADSRLVTGDRSPELEARRQHALHLP